MARTRCICRAIVKRREGTCTVHMSAISAARYGDPDAWWKLATSFNTLEISLNVDACYVCPLNDAQQVRQRVVAS